VQTRKQQPVLIIDEASLLRLDVFAELHTLTQFEAGRPAGGGQREVRRSNTD